LLSVIQTVPLTVPVPPSEHVVLVLVVVKVPSTLFGVTVVSLLTFTAVVAFVQLTERPLQLALHPAFPPVPAVMLSTVVDTSIVVHGVFRALAPGLVQLLTFVQPETVTVPLVSAEPAPTVPGAEPLHFSERAPKSPPVWDSVSPLPLSTIDEFSAALIALPLSNHCAADADDRPMNAVKASTATAARPMILILLIAMLLLPALCRE
jgi:hypothetical protein